MTRARAVPLELELRTGELDELVAHVRDIAVTGSGWVNLRPLLREEDEPPPPSPFTAIFGGSVHKVPTATWLPGKRLANGTVKPTTIGLQHAGGARVARTLRDLGVPLPEGWRVSQDHPRRGLVVGLPPLTPPGVAFDWLLRAATALCAAPTTGRWQASVFRSTPEGTSGTDVDDTTDEQRSE